MLCALAINASFVAAMLGIRAPHAGVTPGQFHVVAVQFLGPLTTESPDAPPPTPPREPPPVPLPTPPSVTPPPDAPLLVESSTPAPTASNPESASAPDPARALVIRMSQLTARVHAAWSGPAERAPSEFHCRVRVTLGDDGDVRSVEWLRCDDNPELRRSLQSAIRSASPLPSLGENVDGVGSVTLDIAALPGAGLGRRAHVEPGSDSP